MLVEDEHALASEIVQSAEANRKVLVHWCISHCQYLLTTDHKISFSLTGLQPVCFLTRNRAPYQLSARISKDMHQVLHQDLRPQLRQRRNNLRKYSTFPMMPCTLHRGSRIVWSGVG